MKALRVIVNSEERLQATIGDLRAAYTDDKYLLVTIDSKRTLDQNAQSHIWYEQVARELREDTPEGVKCESKLRLGVPILRAEVPEFRAFYDLALKRLTYEQKLEAMKYVPITSQMEFDQFQRYLADMQNMWGTRGVSLKFLEVAQKAKKHA